MADTIARLIFEATTDDLKKAQKELDALTKAAGKTSKQIPKVGEGTKKTGKATNKMADSFRNASTATAALQGPLNGLSGRLSFIATGLSRVGAGGLALGAGIAGLGFAVQNSLAIFQSFEQQMFKLEALTKSTGFTAGFTANELNAMAEEIARGTLASAKDIRDAQGVLLTFKSISGDTFKSAIGLTQDIAGVMGTTAVSGAKQLGKALEDPARNLTALTRAGISFSDEETKKIKLLQESGKLFEAQSIIVKTLEEQVGGAGTGGGLSAATDLLSDNFIELNRVIAEETGLAELATAATNGLAKAMGLLAGKISETNEEELKRLQQSQGQRSSTLGVDVFASQRIKELEGLIAAEEKKKEIAKVAAEEQKAIQAEQAALKRDILTDNLELEFNQLREHQLRVQGFTREADRLKLKNMIMQADLEYELAVEKYGRLDELDDIRTQKVANAREAQRQAAVDATAKEEKAEKDYRKTAIAEGKKLVDAAASQSKAAFKVQKAMKIAEAVQNTYSAATGAYNAMASIPVVGPALGAAAAAAAISFGMAQVQAIKSQTFGGGASVSSGGVPSGGGAQAAAAAPVQPAANDEPTQAPQAINVTVDGSIDPEGARRIIEAINEATDDGLEINALVGS
jgi:hypothetical protein